MFIQTTKIKLVYVAMFCFILLSGASQLQAYIPQQNNNSNNQYYFPVVANGGRFSQTASPEVSDPTPEPPAEPTATAQPAEPTATPVPAEPTPTPEIGGGAPIDSGPGDNASDAFYVSKNGSNGDGRSWDQAWSELDRINWSALKPGSVVYIDGGESSMTYRTGLQPQKSGSSDNPITLQLSSAPGRNGQAIFFGGNGIPLPECGQRSWDESQIRNAGEHGIRFDNGIENIVVDGTKRAGIVIHGWSDNGVYFNPDRSGNGQDNNPKNVTLRYMEIYNNGGFDRKSDGSSSNLYMPSHSDPGIKLSGSGHKFEFLEIHDNAGDAIQSAFTNPGGGTYNNIDDITITDSWLYNQRPHSGQDNSPSGEVCTASNRGGCDELGAPQMGPDYSNYPSYPPNRRESFNWCTHSDGVQIFSSNDLNKMTIERSIIGPNFMTGLILGDRNSSNATAWVNDLTLTDVVITRYMHNALGMKNPPNNAGKRWTLNNVTMYGHYNNTNKGTLNIDSNANYNEHKIANTIMVHGRTNFPNGNIAFENNCEHDMYSQTIGGTKADPQFKNIMNQDVFEANLNVDFATVFLDDYTPQNPSCQSKGSRITSARALVSGNN